MAEYVSGSLCLDVGEALEEIERTTDETQQDAKRAEGFKYLSEYVQGVREGVNGALGILGSYTPALTKGGAVIENRHPSHKGRIVETMVAMMLEGGTMAGLARPVGNDSPLIRVSGK